MKKLLIIYLFISMQICLADYNYNYLPDLNHVVNAKQFNNVESVNTYNGAMNLDVVDLRIPGANGMDLEISRHYNSSEYTTLEVAKGRGPLANHIKWHFNFGRLVRVQVPYNNAIYYMMILPSGLSKYFYPLNNQQKDFISQDGWKAEKTGDETIIVTSPKNTVYHFFAGNLGYKYHGRYVYALLSARDVYGNGYDITIDKTRLSPSKITTTQGRVVKFKYLGNGCKWNYCLTQMEYEGKVWKYYYSKTDQPNYYEGDFLRKVELPDGRTWLYNYNMLAKGHVSASGVYNKEQTHYYTVLTEYINPEEAHVKFSYQLQGISFDDKVVNFSLKTRDISEGLTHGHWDFNFTIDKPNRTLTIKNENGRSEYTSFHKWEKNTLYKLGLPLTYKVYNKNSDIPVFQTDYSWEKQVAINKKYYTKAYFKTFFDDATYFPRLSKKITRFSGETLSVFFNDYDLAGNPGAITEDGYEYKRTSNIDYFQNDIKHLEINHNLYLDNQFNDKGKLSQSITFKQKTVYDYDTKGNISKITDALGNETLFEDYKMGLAQTTIDSKQIATHQTIDDYGNITETQDGNGNKHIFKYDAANRLIYEEPPEGLAISTSYEPRTVKTRRGHYKKIDQYDGFGNLLESTEYDTEKSYAHISQQYDSDNQLIQQSKAVNSSEANIHAYTYDNLGRLLSETQAVGTDLSQIVIQNEYLDHFITKTIDAKGHETITTFASFSDPFKLFTTHITNKNAHGESRETSISYDEFGMPSTLIQKQGEYRYGYDENHCLISLLIPEIGNITYGRDVLCSLKSQAINGQNPILFDYDSVGNITKKVVDSEISIFEYDRNYQLQHAITPSVEKTYIYNKSNQVININSQFTDFPKSYNLQYVYDDYNHLREMVYPSGEKVDYQANVLGLPLKVGNFVHHAFYDLSKRLLSVDYNSTLKTDYSYDVLNRLSSLSISSGDGYKYYYDANDNLINKENTITNMSTTYEYDDFDRIISSTVTDQLTEQEAAISYDIADNITARTTAEGTTTFQYSNNELSSLQLDAQKNITTNSSGYLFNFDHENKLRDATNNSHQIHYDYDENNHISVIKHDEATTYQIYGKDSKLYAEIDQNGQISEYFYLLDHMVASKKPNDSYYHVWDNANNVIGTYHQPSSRLVESPRYYPYGEQKPDSKSQASDINFASKHFEQATGLQYFGARFYDPKLGRFLSIDPAPIVPEDPRTYNRYAYAYNNPYKYKDPDGRNPVAIMAAVGFAAWSAYDAYQTYQHEGAVSAGQEMAFGFALSAAPGGKVASKVGGKFLGKFASKEVERVRHFTNSKGVKGIKQDGLIKASDQNSVFTVKAKGKVGSSRDIENDLLIGKGRANNYLEFDAHPSEFSVVKNKVTGMTERVFRGDVNLSGRNPKFYKNR